MNKCDCKRPMRHLGKCLRCGQDIMPREDEEYVRKREWEGVKVRDQRE